MESKQIKSKERVSKHGEVFTNEREVNAMLDLVKQETENIESTFLEPACGDGNFLSAILRRKLTIVKNKYGKYKQDYEKYSMIAISSIYGVELLQDNVDECIKRLFHIWEDNYKECFKDSIDEMISKSCLYILRKNILCGDALTLKKANGNPIIFAEWKLIDKTMLKRRDYRLDHLLETQENFIDLLHYQEGWDFDKDTNEIIPTPVKEFDLIDYRRVYEQN